MLNKIWDMQAQLNKTVGRDTIDGKDKELWLRDLSLAMSQELSEFCDTLNWKWWSKEFKNHRVNAVMDRQNAKVELVDMMHFLVSMMQCMGMTPEDVYSVYKQKHAINLERQRNGYSHIGKTEEDNKTIVT